MPDIFSAFKKAAFGDLEFPYVSLSIKGGLRYHKHEYLHRPAWELEGLGRWGYEFRYGCQFHQDMPSWPDLYPSRLSELISLFESGLTFALYVPNLGREIQAKCVEWPRTLLATVRSGESAEFTFIEDGSEQFTADKLIGTVTRSVPTQFDNVVAQVEKLNNESALSDLDKLSIELDKWLAASSLLQNAPFAFAGLDGLFFACSALAANDALQDAFAAPALTATIALWANVATLKNQALNSQRPLAAYTTENDKMSVVDVSMKIYKGDPSYALELMQLNQLDDAMAIRVGTDIRYLVPAQVSVAA